MSDKKYDDALLSDVLGMISDEGLDEFLTSLPNEDSYPFEISEDFERKMDKMIADKKREERMHKWFKKYRNVAAAVILVALACLFTIQNVDAFRVPFFRFFNNNGTKTMDAGSDEPEYVTKVVYPSYLPERFQFLETTENDLGGVICSAYIGDDGKVYIYQMDWDMAMKNEIEFKAGELKVEEEVNYYLKEEDNMATVSFQYKNYLIQVNGNISLEEAFNIAKSFY